MTTLDLRQLVRRLEGDLVVGLEEAVAIAVRFGHPHVEFEHWALALAENSQTFRGAIEKGGIKVADVVDDASRALQRRERSANATPAISQTVVDLCREAWIAASLRYSRNSVGLLDVLMVALTDPDLRPLVGAAIPAFRDLRLGQIEAAIDERSATLAPAASVDPLSSPPAPSLAGAGPGQFLSAYTIDLTEEAREGKIDPVVGREGELRQVTDILVRRRQNNPILVGEAGVGKTAVAEAFALQVARGDTPERLRDTRLLSLDLGLLKAGAGVKGEFERRLKGVIQEANASPRPVILFIDEAHTLVGGGQSGPSEAADILKPALARGELRTIAATTWGEYKKYFERDAALSRRFQMVKVDEPSEEVAVQMVRSLVASFEAHHGVRIRDEAVRAAVALSKRYIHGRQLPDKAVSLIDTAAGSVSISRATTPHHLADAIQERDLLTQESARLHDEIPTEAIDERLSEIAARIETLDRVVEQTRERHAQELALTCEADEVEAQAPSAARHAAVSEIEKRLKGVQGEYPLVHRVVDKETVAAVASRWTGVPMGKLVRDAAETVVNLENRLKERVVGQDHALKVISGAMATARAGLQDERRPSGVFLLVGTSGVGKTETALALADMLYGGDQALTVINMSEFKEEHKVSLLMGAPPGYVGYGEGGILTEAVRRRPYGVLLLDEIDKAHPGVQDIFYQVFDKGHMKDGDGRDIDFRNTTIIMTANAGTRILTAMAADPETMPVGEALTEMLRPELMEQFKPAFLGRVTIVPYLPLSMGFLEMIAGLQLNRIAERLKRSYRAEFEATFEARATLARRAGAVESGARAIETAISSDLLPKLSRDLLALMVGRNMPTKIRVDVDEAGTFFVDVTEKK
jgi:type VI secretion system protein VasG